MRSTTSVVQDLLILANCLADYHLNLVRKKEILLLVPNLVAFTFF